MIAISTKQLGLLEKYLQLSGIHLLLLFLYCWMGQTTDNVLSNMTNAVYSGGWYLSGARTMKDVRFLMMYTNDRIRMKIGKVVPLSFDTFAFILKRLTSILSICRAMIT